VEIRKMVSIFGMPAEKGRWIFVILGLLINLWFGAIYAWSIFVDPLTQYFTSELGQAVTANDVLLPFSVYLVSLALAMPFSGRLIERFGPSNVAIFGGVMVGLGWILASVSSSVLMLIITYGVIGGIGEGIAYSVLIAVAACWFPDRRGLAVGITVLGIGFSAFFTANIGGYLTGAYGVMNTFRIFGIVIIALTVLLARPMKFPPPGWAPPGYTSSVWQPGDVCECNRARMLRSPAFYGLAACYFLACLAGLMAISITEPVGREIGVGPGFATFLVGFFAIFNGFGRPLFGELTDLVTPRVAAVASFVLIALASFLMWQIPMVPVYVLAFAILWGCLGGWLAIAPATTGNYFGTCDYPRCYGVVFLAYGAGAVAGPQLGGSFKTVTGSYMGVFPVVFALAMAGMIIAFVLLHPPKTGISRR
jgi:MFS transporter, OFA family, oxalate/formate antiporter